MEDRRIHVMIDGEQQDLSLDKWNKNGGASSFAKEFPNAEVRMRDNSGQDYSVPISQFSSAAQKGLHMFTYSTTPDRTKPIMSGIKNDILARPIDNFAKTAFNRTIQQPKKLAEKEIEPIQVNQSKPITTQLPNATLYNVQQDADKEFDTSIAPKIDKLYSQQIQRGNAAAEQFDATHIAPPEAGIGMGLAKSKAISDATDAGDIVTNIRDYISSKQKAGKGTGSGIDPRTERIMSRTIDYLAQKQMPKSTIEYILRNMYDNSLIGSVANLGLSKSSTQQQVEQRGNGLYKPSKATQIASGVGSLLLDSPLFGAGGKLASGITKLGVKGAQRIIADKLIEASGKTLAKDVAMQQAARVMASNTPKAVFGRIAQGISDTALNLGGYDATSDIVGQTNAIKSGAQDEYNIGQTIKRGLWGAATGAASGILGGTVGHLSRNLSGVGKALSDFGGYVGDSSVFAGMSALQKYANGEPVDLTEDAIDSFATLGAMKIGHIGSAIRNWSKASAEERKQMQDALNFTPEDKESLSKYGIDGNDLIGTIGKLSHQTTEIHAVPGKILSENGRYVVRDAGKEETKKVEKDFDTIMKAPDIPISTKNKVLYMVKGRQVVTPMTSYNISKNGDKARLTTYDWANRPILVKDFKTDKDAKQYASRNDYDNNILRNTASVLENINDKNINSTYKNIVANNIYNAVNGGNYADLSEGEKRVVDSYNNQLGEAMKASVDEIKRTSGIDVESLLNTPRELLTPQQADAVDKYNEDFNSYKKDNDIRNDIKEALNPEYTFDDTKPHSLIERTRDKRIIEIREAIDEDRLSNDNYLDNMSSSIKSKVKEDTGIDINKALESKTRTKEEDDAIGTYIEALKKNIGADTKEEPDMETQKYIIADNFSKATENVTDIDPNNPKPDDEQKIKDYDDAKQQFGNYVEYVNNKAKQAADEAENWAKELSNKKMNGLIVTATTPLSENPIYIVDGQIVHKEDGSIDYDKSDPEIIYVDPNDGKRKMASLQNADGNFITDVNYDNYDTYVKSVRQQAEDEVRAKEQQDFDNRDQMSEGLPKNEVSPTEEIEQNVSEQPNEQIRPVPLDENGKPVYHKAPIESTLKDMRDKGADDDTISEFAQMRVDALTKEQSKLDKQKPAPSDDFSVFQQNKAALQSQKKDVSDQLDYWNNVYNSLQQTEQPVEPSTGQQPSEQVEPQTVQPIEQQPNMSTQQNTEQQPIESAPTKTIKVRNRPLGPKRYYTKESKEMGAPTSLREAVMRAIAEGDYKFQWKDNTSDKTKGLGSHLGYGEKERKQMIGFTASKENGGMPPEVVAEKIKGELGEQFPNATDQDIFDEILDIFGTYGGSRKAIWNAAKEQHGVDQNAEEEEYYRGQLEAEAYYNHMSPEEYEAYEYDYIPSYLEERYNSDTDDDINERLSTFADIINSENNENNSEGTSTVYGQLPERKGLQPGTEGSDSVLPESGSIQYGNDSESNEIRENSTDKADEVGNDDVHGQFVPATDEGITARREFDIKLQNAKLALENAQKEYDKKLKSINDRNGLFGDTKDDGTSMFGDTSDFSKGTVDKSLEPYKAKIEAAKRDIDKLNESRDAFIKQQETQRNIDENISPEELKNRITYQKNSGKVIRGEFIDHGWTSNHNGSKIEDGMLIPGGTLKDNQQSYTWWNTDKPYSMGVENKPFDVFYVMDRNDIKNLINVREQPYPIGQWSGSKGFVTNSEMVTEYPVDLRKADIYIRNSDGTYRKVNFNEFKDIVYKLSPTNIAINNAESDVDTNPTEAQKEAGNYKKGHVNIDGMNFTIENPKGSTRSGKDSDGEEWHTVMNNTYGYIKGTKGIDGDHIDMYLSDNPTEGNVYVIDQINPKTREFDEHKVMYGFNSENEAKDAYLSNYSKGWKGLGKITEVSKDEFKKWIDSSTRKTKPFSDYKSVNAEPAPIGKGPFGNIYDQFKGKSKEAISFLSRKKDGEAIAALHHKDVGDIDLVWGKEGTSNSDGYGLAKLVKYHPEALERLQDILNDMHVTKRTDNRIQLESDKYQSAIRLTWDNKKKTWLLTMFEKKNSALDNTTDTVETQSGNGNDTATPENTVSVSKDKNNTLNNKELEDNYINEIFDKAKRGSNSNISIDKSKTFPEDLQVGFKINGEESNIGACLRLTDNIHDEPIFKATYFNDALSYDELSNAIDRFNEDKGKTIATDDGDSKYIYFPTVDDAIEFNDSIENKLDEPLEATNEKRMSEIVEELSDVESRMMELEDNDLTDSSEYGNLKSKMGDLESEYKGLKTINEESNRIQNGINEPSPTYKTGSGKKITFTPIQFNLFTNNAPIKNSRDTLSGPHLDELKPGDICNVERVFSKTKSFEFYGNNKIESYEDVAYIFKNLEDEAIEHSFMVYIKNGKATVLHMCMGDFSAVMTNPAAGKYADHIIDSDEVYFVHNHPSGNLKPSAQDMKVNARMKELFGKKLKDSIIIDRKSGKFAIFDEYSSGILDEKNNINKKEPVEVYEFNKLSFGSDSIPPTKISSSYDVAEFVSTQRLGDRKKINYLIISQAGEITADIQTPFIDFKNTKKIGDDIINKVAQFGGTQAIIYGDFELENSTPIKSINGYIQNAGVRLCDVIKIDGNNTKYDLRFKSAMDEGMAFDPNQVKPTVNNDKIKDVRFRNSSQLDAQYPSWLSGQVNDNGKHSTQISGTVKTYDKIGKWVEDTIGKDATILDASSGLGVGTESLRKQGFNVDDVEPYPSKDRIKPTYAKYDDIDKKYDVIISNAVLNVIPDDWRADVLKNMADKLNVGGKLIINVRDAKEIENQKQKIELDSPSEILVTDSKGRIRAYQKGFTEQELIKFAQDTLGKGWNVEKANNANSGIGGARAIVITRETGDKLKYRPIDKIEEEKNNISNARNKRIVAAAENLSNSLHTVLNIVHSNEIDGKKSKAKAWYDVKEDKVYLVPENNIDEADAEQSILHEVVAHKGLRKMFGEDFDNAMWDIYKSIPEEERKKIAKEASDRYDNDFVEATEEYLASMAEKGVDKPSLWKRIVSRIRELLRKVGIKLKMSDNDIKYLLWKSRRGMEADVAKEFEVKENIFGNVEHAPLEPLFRIDPKDLNGKDMQQQVELAKTVAELNEQEVGDYLERMKHQVLFEAWIDKTNPIRVLQDTLMKHYGTELPDDCDAHLAYNVMTSRGQIERSYFESEIHKPLLKVIKSVGEYEDVVNYLIAKHGLERNDVMRNSEVEELKKAYENAGKDIDSDNFKKAVVKIMIKDFAGLTGLQRELEYKETGVWKSDLSNVHLSDDYINKFVSDFEGSHDNIDQMWNIINIATDFSLETQRKYGCISKEQLDNIKSMYKYYIPLRDWADPRAEDSYEYMNTEKYDGLNMPLKKAFGRKSKAGDPVANIASMADSAIATGNKNRVKQHMFRLVFNYPSNLAHISPVWYSKDEATGETKEVVFEPKEGVDYDSAFEEFKTHMDELEKNGIINKAYPRLAVGKPIKKWQATQHSVRVKINGKDYIIYMDSSPRAAQAINGDNVNTGTHDLTFLKWAKDAMNFMARNFTSRMLNFVLRNFFRDYTGALTYNYIYKYGSMLDFAKASPVAAKTLSEYLLKGKIPEGKYGDYFREFLENGGETGYGNAMSYNDFVSDIKKDIEKAKNPSKLQAFRWLGKGLDMLNRGAEDTTRLTAYIASRESGKSVMQSIKSAKEISVNFSRSGSGAKGNAEARIWYMFLNAGIQATYNTVRAFKNHPVKSSLAFGTWAGIGFLNGVMQYYMTGDNDYFDIPDWVRQNNLAIKIGQGTMVSLPLALEIRPFFAIGDILAQYTLGKYNGKNVAVDVATKFMESAPYNFFEGTTEGGNNPAEVLENTIVPSAFKPFMDVLITNKDYTGKPISKQNEFNKYVPEYKKGYRSTSEIAIEISKMLNKLSSGDNATKGFMDNRLTNPAVMEYLFNNYGGGVAKQIFESAKSAVNAISKNKEVAIRDIPVASAVIYKFDSSKQNTNVNQMYYNYINDMEESKSRDREYLKDAPKDPSSIKGYVNKKSDIENEKKVAIISFYKSIIGNLSEERKMVPDDSETAKNIDSNIFKLKKAMVEQLEKY